MTELTETCGSGRCECYIHDYVAELIGVRSTRKDGYDPHKPVSLGWVDKHPEEAEQIVLKALEKESDAKRRERFLAETEAELNYLLPSTVKGPDGYRGATGPGLVPRSGATGPTPLGYYRGEPIYTERDEYDGLDYVYEFGNPEPISVQVKPTLPYGYSIASEVNGPVVMKYEKTIML